LNQGAESQRNQPTSSPRPPSQPPFLSAAWSPRIPVCTLLRSRWCFPPAVGPRCHATPASALPGGGDCRDEERKPRVECSGAAWKPRTTPMVQAQIARTTVSPGCLIFSQDGGAFWPSRCTTLQRPPSCCSRRVQSAPFRTSGTDASLYARKWYPRLPTNRQERHGQTPPELALRQGCFLSLATDPFVFNNPDFSKAVFVPLFCALVGGTGRTLVPCSSEQSGKQKSILKNQGKRRESKNESRFGRTIYQKRRGAIGGIGWHVEAAER
jgi:hypothetical protein